MAAPQAAAPPAIALGPGPFYSIDVECVVRALAACTPPAAHHAARVADSAAAPAQAIGTDHNARAVAQISLINQVRRSS
jgi:hypothetical protein